MRPTVLYLLTSIESQHAMLFHETAITFSDMAKAVVLLFLLETIPDFDVIINKTLHNVGRHVNGIPCNPIIIASVLKVVSQKFGHTSDSVEGLFNDGLRSDWYKPSRFLDDANPDSLNNLENLLENSEHQSFEKVMEKSSVAIGTMNYADAEQAVNDEIPETYYLKSNGLSNRKNVPLPDRPPFLAAIFETVSSVTAQTCAGVLLSRDWVLTAATCINVLRPFYGNSSSQIHNYYTIVIGASNPLIDGTVHNVSKIVVYPTSEVQVNANQSSLDPMSKSESNVTTAMLALMRIQPSLERGGLEVMREADWGGSAIVYGWALNEGGPDMMVETALPVEVLSPAQCKSTYGVITERPSMICLSMNDTTGNVTRMNSGGPVVVSQGGRPQLLAIALTDSTTPLTAYRLPDHLDWLRNTTRNDEAAIKDAVTQGLHKDHP